MEIRARELIMVFLRSSRQKDLRSMFVLINKICITYNKRRMKCNTKD
jgi:hypothetical protein